MKRYSIQEGLLTATALAGALAMPATAATTWYVDADAALGGDGSSWQKAFQFLQDALHPNENPSLQDGDQIWVAEGTYYPPDGLLLPVTDPRTFSFDFSKAVSIYGGFLGTGHPNLPLGEDSLNQRDPERNVTILSGDIDQDGLLDEDNSFRLVRAIDVAVPGSLLNGFTITQGLATASAEGGGFGGGMYIQDASPTVVRCIFVENSATSRGGAVAIFNVNPPTQLTQFVNCSFIGNYGGNHAGGVICLTSDVTFDNCLFSGNSTGGNHGGAIVNTGVMDVNNCTLSRNSAVNFGGAIAFEAPTTLRNCVVWGNTPDQFDGIDPDVFIYYSDIQGGWTGQGFGNIGDDPVLDNPSFCDDDGADDVVGTLDDNLRLQDGSPCIDTGRDTLLPTDVGDVDDDLDRDETLPWDLDKRDRQFDALAGGTRVDMGAYENQHVDGCPWDIAGLGGGPPDGSVGIDDFLELLGQWGDCPGCAADFDCNLEVDADDYNELLDNWGPCP